MSMWTFILMMILFFYFSIFFLFIFWIQRLVFCFISFFFSSFMSLSSSFMFCLCVYMMMINHQIHHLAMENGMNFFFARFWFDIFFLPLLKANKKKSKFFSIIQNFDFNFKFSLFFIGMWLYWNHRGGGEGWQKFDSWKKIHLNETSHYQPK